MPEEDKLNYFGLNDAAPRLMDSVIGKHGAGDLIAFGDQHRARCGSERADFTCVNLSLKVNAGTEIRVISDLCARRPPGNIRADRKNTKFNHDD